MLCEFEEAFRHFTLEAMLSFSLNDLISPPLASHQLKFISFILVSHSSRKLLPKAHRRAKLSPMFLCVLVLHTSPFSTHFCCTLLQLHVVVSFLLFPTANVSNTIFFNSFCNLLWRRVHADFFPPVTIFRISYFFSSSLRYGGEEKAAAVNFVFIEKNA